VRSKAEREFSHGLPVENFFFSSPTHLFSQNNGFPAFFLLLYPSFLQAETQRGEQQFYPHILLSGC
jgi:hypothetical protein